MSAQHTLNLPLVRWQDDMQPALRDQNPTGSRHLLILYGPDDGEPNIEFIRRAINSHAELLELVQRWLIACDLSGVDAEKDGAIPDNPSLNPYVQLLRDSRAIVARVSP